MTALDKKSTPGDGQPAGLRLPTGSVPESAPHVLVADDARVTREILGQMLISQGFNVTGVSSGERALEHLREQIPDVVLMDVNMDQLTGFDVLRIMRSDARLADVPVLIITAESDRQLLIRAFREGANDYLTKPLDPEVTLARVSLHLRLRRAQLELQRSEERYALAAQGSGIGLWDWDVDQNKIFFSTRWKEMLGFSEHEFEATVENWFGRLHHDDSLQFMDMLTHHATLEGGRFERELRMRHKDGNYRWMLCTGMMLTDVHGNPRRLAGSLADITEGKVRDVLTSLPNRLLFEEKVERALQSAQEEHELCAVLFLDLDNFKLVNDSLGHDAGDLLLCNVARRLESSLRKTDVVLSGASSWSVARHGGDEFTVLLKGLHDRQGAEEVANRIIGTLAETFQLGANEVSIGVSIGISFGDCSTKTPADVIREADTAMYYAKSAGRGTYRVFDPEMQTVASARLKLESDLRQAIKSQQFYLVYQPVIRLGSQRVEGFEALCRWKHPRGEQVGPETFIPVIESLGLIGKLSRIVLEEAVVQLKQWNRQFSGSAPLSITVNCSTREFCQPQFRYDLIKLLKTENVDPRLLKIEVTESTLMENPEVARVVVGELRAAGFRIGIDDFGTGYSSLAYLHRLPLDLLKIDKSFVRDMLSSTDGREIVRTIVTLAQSLNLDIVAEGVETEIQRKMLFDLGCTHAQGYLFSRPLSVQDLTTLMQKPEWQNSFAAPGIASDPVFQLPDEEFDALAHASVVR